MATVHSLLMRKDANSPRRRAPQGEREARATQYGGEDMAEIDALVRTVARLSADLEAAKADANATKAELAASRGALERATADLTQERTRGTEMGQHLGTRAAELEQARLALAAAQATITGVTGQLETERATRAALQSAHEQAMAAAANRPASAAPTPPPPPAPTAYEMQVVGRDVNSRVQRVRFLPVQPGST